MVTFFAREENRKKKLNILIQMVIFFDLVKNRNNPKRQKKPYAQDVNFNLITEKWPRIKSMAWA